MNSPDSQPGSNGVSSSAPIHTREQLIGALAEAAQLEHDITCQYLFTAFSLKTHPDDRADWVQIERVRGWKAELLRIARQEMAHHGLVCNLAIVVGGVPYFRRAAFPHPTAYCSPYERFDLGRFDAATLERFACYEHLHGRDTLDGGDSIGALYAHIRAGFERLEHTNPKLFIGPTSHQIVNEDLSIRHGQFDVELVRAHDVRSAVALVDRICDHDHHERILAIRDELEDMQRRDPSFEPARAVARNPRTQPVDDPSVTVVSHPLTLAAARLFNDAYEAMTMMLSRIYGRADETGAEVAGLVSTAFFPLMTAVVRPLGEMLTEMPVSEGAPSPTAGPCFELSLDLPLQPFKRSAWVFLHERLQSMARAAVQLHQQLRESAAPWPTRVLPRMPLLCENLERIAHNFERDMKLKPVYVRHMLERLM